VARAIIIDFDVSNLFSDIFYMNSSIYDLVVGLHCQSFRDAENPVKLWYDTGKKAGYLHGSFWRRKKVCLALGAVDGENAVRWLAKGGPEAGRRRFDRLCSSA